MSALVIDVILWGSVAALAFMAWQRGRTVLVTGSLSTAAPVLRWLREA